MKLTIDIPSALITLSAVGIAAVLAGAAPIQSSASDRDVQAVEDLSQPHPRDFVRIQQGTPFVVPSDSILVIKGMSFANPNGAAGWSQTIQIDGVPAFSDYGWFRNQANVGTWHASQVTEIPLGVTAGEGSTVEAVSNRSDCVLLGYLADA